MASAARVSLFGFAISLDILLDMLYNLLMELKEATKMTIQEQIDSASRRLADATRNLGYRHPDRLAVLDVVRELQAERKRREEAGR